MAKFMFLQRGGCDERPEMTPEQMEAGMKVWQQWMTEGQEAGWLLDPGSALGKDGAVVQPDLSVIDGPFAESKELVGGYSVLQATDYDQAAEYAKTCPIIHVGGSIEIRELAGFKE